MNRSCYLHVCVDSLCPSQQFRNFAVMSIISCLPGSSQYKAEDNVSCSRTQLSASSQSLTSDPSTTSLPQSPGSSGSSYKGIMS